MKNFALLAALTITTLIPNFATAEENAREKAEKTLKAFGEHMVGRWTHTNDDGAVTEHEYKWAINKRFVQMRVIEGSPNFMSIIGVDPKTNKVTRWYFSHDDEGGYWKGEATIEREGKGWRTTAEITNSNGTVVKMTARQAPMGKNAFEGEIAIKMDGQERPPTKRTWKRKKK